MDKLRKDIKNCKTKEEVLEVLKGVPKGIILALRPVILKKLHKQTCPYRKKFDCIQCKENDGGRNSPHT